MSRGQIPSASTARKAADRTVNRMGLRDAHHTLALVERYGESLVNNFLLSPRIHGGTTTYPYGRSSNRFRASSLRKHKKVQDRVA
jgi:hypothetical protein